MTTTKKTGDEARRLSDLSEDIGIRFQYPNSDRVYIPGSRADIRVPLREIRQDDTYTAQGTEANPPIPVYDTSGVYGDPAAHTIRKLPICVSTKSPVRAAPKQAAT